MPGNRGIAYGRDIDYAVIAVKAVGEGSLARVGERFPVAEPLLESVLKAAKITALVHATGCADYLTYCWGAHAETLHDELVTLSPPDP